MRVTHFIDGEFVEPSSGTYLPNIEPATGSTYGEVAAGNPTDVDLAVRAASRAFPGWSSTPVERRSQILSTLASLIEARLEEFARAESMDTGKPITLARTVDIPRAINNLRFFATAITHFHSESHSTNSDAINVTLRKPRGVCALISPWNLPLYLFTWKIAPALATGNTAVGKPSELTPATAYLLSTLCAEAGMPPGVLNIVHGHGQNVGAPLVAHADVDTISFTGGTATGAAIAETVAPAFKKVALEMGGKNASIIFSDADIEQAVRTTMASSFSNQGQICHCGSRILVHRTVYNTFLTRLVERVNKLEIGDPLDAKTDQGAVVSEAHLQKIRQYIKLAVDEGGTLVAGGTEPPRVTGRCADGFFVTPTVVTGLDMHCRVNQEEIFGPVVTVTPFDSDGEAVGYANATPYGLSASIWTRDISRAYRVADALVCGTVWVNCWMVRDLRVPIGGTKRSGLGHEGGVEALRFFTDPKNVCVAI